MMLSKKILRKKEFGHGLFVTKKSSSKIICRITSSLLFGWQRKRTFATSSSTTIIMDEVQFDDVNNNNINSNNTLLSNIIRPYFEKQIPVIVRNGISHFPAISKWNSLDYIERKLTESTSSSTTTTTTTTTTTVITGGVEIGGSYGSSNTERAEIPVLDYIQYIKFFEEKYGRYSHDDGDSKHHSSSIPTLISKEELVYMAQNSLFDCLYDDIQIPDFCCQEEEGENQVGLGRLYNVMLWIGPRACTSPMHYDPLDNAYMQIVGRKLFILYPPTGGEGDNSSSGSNSNSNRFCWHYAGHDGQQSNTSPVNPEQIDEEKYPYFVSDAPTQIQTIVYPGDLLYIPSKWWHYVRSLDTAISVNAWWR